MIDLGIYIAETRICPYHTEAGAVEVISFKVACIQSILETRTSLAHTEDVVTDVLSLKVAYNPHKKMVAEISGSGGPWV